MDATAIETGGDSFGLGEFGNFLVPSTDLPMPTLHTAPIVQQGTRDDLRHILCCFAWLAWQQPHLEPLQVQRRPLADRRPHQQEVWPAPTIQVLVVFAVTPRGSVVVESLMQSCHSSAYGVRWDGHLQHLLLHHIADDG